MRRFLILLALVLSCQVSYGQRQSFAGYVQAGDEAVEQQDFHSAYQFYRIALEYANNEGNPEVLYKLGSAANMADAYGVSTEALLKLAELPEADQYPNLHYYLGENYTHTGAYDLGALNYESFLEKYPNADVGLRSRAERQITHANWAINELEKERDINVSHLNPPVNSAYSDYGYTQRPNGEVYFSSMRFDFKKDTVNPSRRLSKILFQKGDKEAKPLKGEMDMNTQLVSHTAFNEAGNLVVFSVCSYVGFKETSCSLYRADVAGSGDFRNIRPLVELNEAGSNSQMPNFGVVNGKEMLFFASNRSGGKGGLDIYGSRVENDNLFAAPINLMDINSEGDDVTPFYLNDRETLFFATNGRFTFGGLDIYKVYFSDDFVGTPINLGSPVNTSFDDAYYAQYSSSDKAYLSSTRQTSDAIFFDGEKEVCCYDIYSFDPDNRIDLIVNTFDGWTKEDLVGATVTLCEITDNGPVVVETIERPDGNNFAFQIEPNRRYELKATKDGYTKAIDGFDLRDPAFANKGMIKRDVYLMPSLELEVLSFDNNDKSSLEGVNVQLFVVDENGEETLVEEKTNPTANDVTFNVKPGNKYIIRGLKNGYGDDETTLDLTAYVATGSNKISKELYLGQLLEILVVDGLTNEPLPGATVELGKLNGESLGVKTNETGNDFSYRVTLNKSFVANTSRPGYVSGTDTLVVNPEVLAGKDGVLRYEIPLYPDNLDAFPEVSLYYDNDHPNPRTYTKSTSLGYDDTYFPYIQSESEFITESIEGIEDEDVAFDLETRLEDFFNVQVKGGYKRLKAFTTVLRSRLEAGESVHLNLFGYASPRAKTNYNRLLSGRRNMAVKNYFRRYENGALMPYIKSGKLKFTEKEYGENRPTADEISDRIDDPKASVYSVIASLQRRVVIEVANKSSNRK